MPGVGASPAPRPVCRVLQELYASGGYVKRNDSKMKPQLSLKFVFALCALAGAFGGFLLRTLGPDNSDPYGPSWEDVYLPEYSLFVELP